MNEAELNNIKVDVETRYIEDQSNPEQNYYVFAYTITIKKPGQAKRAAPDPSLGNYRFECKDSGSTW